MKRIKTFKLFEAVYDNDDPSSEKFVNELNDKLMITVGIKTFPMGLHGIRCEFDPLMVGKHFEISSTGKVIALGGIHCLLRSLILGMLFGIPEEEEEKYKLVMMSGPHEEDEMEGFFSISGLSPGMTLLPEDPARMRDILDSVIKHFDKAEAIKCGLYNPNSAFMKNGKIFETGAGFLSMLAKTLLDSPGAINLESAIAEHLKKTGSTKLIDNLVKNKPELWQKVKSLLGQGGTQMEELADLGF